MTIPIPEKFHDLFSRPILCGLTTISPNGQPHSVPVWCDFDGEHVRINMPAATKKARNLKRNPKVSLLIIDPQSGRHWIEIQGHVGEPIDEAHGAREHINKLSRNTRATRSTSRMAPAASTGRCISSRRLRSTGIRSGIALTRMRRNR